MARASPLAAFSLLVLVALPLFLADPAAATCSSVVCPRLSDTVCGPCEKAFKKSNAGIDDPCCKTFGCKPDPDMPCCGVTCTSPEDELARCNLFEERSSIANSLLPQYGTRCVPSFWCLGVQLGSASVECCVCPICLPLSLLLLVSALASLFFFLFFFFLSCCMRRLHPESLENNHRGGKSSEGKDGHRDEACDSQCRQRSEQLKRIATLNRFPFLRRLPLVLRCVETCFSPTPFVLFLSISSHSLPTVLSATRPRDSYLRLVRPAKPSKGKCCDKYRCETDFEALCANITANAPCPTSADCGICSTAQVTALPDPESGRCCPTFTCVRDAQCLCDNRTNTDCPVPTCNALEDLVLVEAADPDSNDCCDEYKCEPNNERICEAQNIADGYTGPVCDDCKLPVVTVPARTERLRCQDEWVCVADPTDLCCGFNSSDCAAPPTCGAFEVLERTREIDILEGVCCESFKCVKNYTEVCANIPCEYASAAEYMADRCPNPEGRDWYFVIVKKEADPENGVCCPKYKCRETAEKKVYDLERKSSRRRRRRSSAASVP